MRYRWMLDGFVVAVHLGASGPALQAQVFFDPPDPQVVNSSAVCDDLASSWARRASYLKEQYDACTASAEQEAKAACGAFAGTPSSSSCWKRYSRWQQAGWTGAERDTCGLATSWVRCDAAKEQWNCALSVTSVRAVERCREKLREHDRRESALRQQASAYQAGVAELQRQQQAGQQRSAATYDALRNQINSVAQTWLAIEEAKRAREREYLEEDESLRQRYVPLTRPERVVSPAPELRPRYVPVGPVDVPSFGTISGVEAGREGDAPGAGSGLPDFDALLASAPGGEPAGTGGDGRERLARIFEVGGFFVPFADVPLALAHRAFESQMDAVDQLTGAIRSFERYGGSTNPAGVEREFLERFLGPREFFETIGSAAAGGALGARVESGVAESWRSGNNAPRRWRDSSEAPRQATQWYRDGVSSGREIIYASSPSGVPLLFEEGGQGAVWGAGVNGEPSYGVGELERLTSTTDLRLRVEGDAGGFHSVPVWFPERQDDDWLSEWWLSDILGATQQGAATNGGSP